MAGREVDRLGRREGLAIGISMNLGKTVPRVAGGVSVDRIIIEHANNLGHVSSFPHQGRIADTRRLLPDGRISGARSEEHTSELQSLMRISYAVFCLKKNNTHHFHTHNSSYCTASQTKAHRLPN